MKIIKPGTDKPKKVVEWERELACTGGGNKNDGCGAVLLVAGTDLFETELTSMDGSATQYVTFRCPQCKALTDVKEKIEFRIPTQLKWMKDNPLPVYRSKPMPPTSVEWTNDDPFPTCKQPERKY